MNKQNTYFLTGRKCIILTILCSIALTALLAVAFRDLGNRHSQPESQPQIIARNSIDPPPDYGVPRIKTADETELAVQSTASGYPVGKLLMSSRREAYISGDMTLEIPRLKLVCDVLDGTGSDTLNKGVCLFEYAQLPCGFNSNTSIVAHRDIYGREFLNIHKITDGDFMYLTYEGKKYTYEYFETLVTDSSDWEPIKVRDFACITLQSCDPIGIADNRIFVMGRLIGVEDDESDS